VQEGILRAAASRTVIQVKWKVKLYRDRPEIAVSGPDQIEIVDKK
jgi:hypothetical protein